MDGCIGASQPLCKEKDKYKNHLNSISPPLPSPSSYLIQCAYMYIKKKESTRRVLSFANKISVITLFHFPLCLRKNDIFKKQLLCVIIIICALKSYFD